MAMTEDFTLFFDTAEFAVSAVYTPAGGSAQPAGKIIYDENGTVLGDMGIQTTGPAALCPTTLWPGIAEGGALVVTLPVGAKSFVIRVAEPLDDGGLTLLTLAHTN